MDANGASGSNVNGTAIAAGNTRRRGQAERPAAGEPTDDGEGDGPVWHWACVNGSIPEYNALHAELAEHMRISLADARMCPYCGAVVLVLVLGKMAA